jgi:hypothetical protein
MDVTTLPIIIADKNGRDLIIYHSVEEAELHLEGIDIINNEYIGFDAEGYVLDLEVLQTKKPLLGGLFHINRERVIIKRNNRASKQIDELRNRLLDYLNYRGMPDESMKNESLTQLIQKVGFYRES